MAAAPIASTDLCQRGLHRVRLILVHLFAHPVDGGRPLRSVPTGTGQDTRRKQVCRQADADLKAATSPPNPNVNRQNPPGERPDSGITYRSDCGILRDLFGNPVQDVHIGAQMAVLARMAER